MEFDHLLRSRTLQLGVLVALVLSAGYWMRREPSAKSRAQKMILSDSSISLDGIEYAVQWESEPRTFEGLVRDVGTEFNKFAPYRTHYVLLTTGDYSNETKVEIKNKQVLAHLDGDLEGTIRIVEVVPPRKRTDSCGVQTATTRSSALVNQGAPWSSCRALSSVEEGSQSLLQHRSRPSFHFIKVIFDEDVRSKAKPLDAGVAIGGMNYRNEISERRG